MRRPDWLVHDQVWFPRAVVVATAVVAALCVSSTPGTAAQVEVLVGSAVALIGMVARLRFPAVPVPVVLVTTYVPVVVLLGRDRSEGLVFVLILGLILVLTETSAPVRRTLTAGLSATLPLGVHLLSGMRLDGWPFWTGGILLTWFSVEQNLRFQALVTELERTRDRLAMQAVQLERRRIAADLHDIVGHSLGVILLHVTGARRRVGDNPAAALAALTRAEDIGRTSLAEMRRNAAALRDLEDYPRAPRPRLDDVALLVAELRAAGTPVELECDGDVSGVEPVVGLAAYRVVQESLVNSSRHAAGAAVLVGLRVCADTVLIEVSDAGGAQHLPAPAGVGIVGMRERVEALGGTLTAGPTAQGWRVVAEVPRAGSRRATVS